MWRSEEILPQNFITHVKKCDKEAYEKEIKGPTGRTDAKLNEKERKLYVLGVLRVILVKSLAFSSLTNCQEFVESQKVLNSSVEGISTEYLIEVLNEVVKLIKKEVSLNF